MTTPAPLKSGGFRDARVAPLLKLAAAPDLARTTVPSPEPSTTPIRLRRAQVVAVIVLLVLGAVAAFQQFDLRNQLATAPQLADQYDRLATIEAHLIEARILANQQASGVGSDPTTTLNQAAAALVTATAQRPSDQTTLAEVSQAMLTYAALLRSPTTAAQRARADELLTATLQPKLQELRSTLQAETAQRSWSSNAAVLWLAAIVAAAMLISVSVELAQRTHRRLNLGLFLAVIAALATVWLGLAGLARADAANQSTRTDTIDQVVTLSQARLDVADLRYQLTNAAVARTLPAAKLKLIDTNLSELTANNRLPEPETAALVKTYTAARTSAAQGDWAALTAAVSSAEETDQAFDTALTTATVAVISAGTASNQAALNTLQGQAIAAVVFAIAGAAAGYWGIGRRLREYR